jgi:hypothetical protein
MKRAGVSPAGFVGDVGLYCQSGEQDPDGIAHESAIQGEGGEEAEDGIGPHGVGEALVHDLPVDEVELEYDALALELARQRGEGIGGADAGDGGFVQRVAS